MIRRLRYRVLRLLWSPRMIRMRRLFAARRTPNQNLATARKILVVRPDGIGDVVLTTPFLRELRRNAPAARIIGVIRGGVRNAVETLPYVDEWIEYEPHPEFLRPAAYRHARDAALRLERGIDIAILPRFEIDYYGATHLMFFSGAARRVSYSEHVTPAKRRLNPDYDVLLTDAVTGSPAQHEVLHSLNLLRSLGGSIETDHLEIRCTAADHAAAEIILRDVTPGYPVIALGIGAREKNRLWPVENFVDFALMLSGAYRFVVLGGPGDRDRAAPLINRLGSDRVIDGTTLTLREATALLTRCALFVGNDSGPMHLAAAAKVPIVEVSAHPRNADPAGHNSPVRFGPWQVAHQVCQPDHAAPECRDGCVRTEPHCILNVSVDTAAIAAREMLAQRGAARV